MMQQQFRNVLAATDFSAIGNNAVMAAIDICKKHQAVLHLLHVVERKYVVNVAEYGIGAFVMNNDDQEARSQLYNMYERILKAHEIAVRIHMPAGIAHEEICTAAAELPVDLIVMGSHGMSGFKEFFIGSTVFKVIRTTARSVLTIPGGYMPGQFNNILFPVRPVKAVVEKFRFIQPLLHPDSQLHIALVYDDTDTGNEIDYETQLAEILLSLRALSVNSSIDICTTSNPAAKVLELCAKTGADLLVINATLDYHWTQFLSGSYTRQVVNHATVPVLSFQQEVPGRNEQPGQLLPPPIPVKSSL